MWWVEVLRKSKRVTTYQLAMAVLSEAFKCEQIGGEVILTTTSTGMLRGNRWRAAKELVELGLIETEQNGKEALRVSMIHI